MRDQLLAWLDAGCPHYMFDMNWGLAVITEPGPETQPTCGTACCIGGYVAEQMGLNPLENQSAPWDRIQDLALDALELPHIDNYFGHPLFDPELAPQGCTPTQAAIAARFAFANPDHENPWEALNEHRTA